VGKLRRHDIEPRIKIIHGVKRDALKKLSYSLPGMSFLLRKNGLTIYNSSYNNIHNNIERWRIMLLDTDRMIPITKLQKELPKRIRDISAGGSPLYVLKNNEMEAVMLAPAEYEYLMNLSELIEQYEINDAIIKRMKNYKRSKNTKWQDLK